MSVLVRVLSKYLSKTALIAALSLTKSESTRDKPKKNTLENIA